jgi:polyketide biosynthesis enoyl-CoA hydratase PksH
MTAPALICERGAGWHRAVMNRPEQHNSLTPELIDALLAALDACEQDSSARAFILEGNGGYFSSGMDLTAAASGPGARGAGGEAFLRLLKRFTTSQVVVVSNVDGKASGGGVGLAAASDFVFATPRSQFSLPEVLWGLLPCAVAPFLIRRVGFQVCQRMTLSTLPVRAEMALTYGLVDAIDDGALGKLLQRLRSIAPESTGKAKRYLSRLWIINDAMLDCALDELDALLASSEVSQRLREFAEHNRYPWEKPSASVGVPGKAGRGGPP